MIITIDGPTASGKSTVARLLAEQLGFMYINSGFLFRGLAYMLLKKVSENSVNTRIGTKSGSHSIDLLSHNLPLFDTTELEKLMTEEQFHYRFVKDKGPEVFVRHEHITSLLKTPEIDKAASVVALHPSVRQVLLEFQLELARNHDVVADGRDCGTVVFPHAEYKFFLTASVDVRAARWQREQELLGKKFMFEEAFRLVEERDNRDSQRSVAPLKPASDAYIIDSSNMTVQEVITEIIAVVRR